MHMAITDKYELQVSPISFAGRSLEIYEVVKSDRFVESVFEETDLHISRFPFWVKVWEAAIVLADHLLHAGLDPAASVLEIGSGMGIAGLLLGSCGHDVTITDFEPDALELLEMNVRHNRLDNVRVQNLDWHQPGLDRKFDMICGSELIYNEASIEPVTALLDTHLRTGGTVYLTHDVRRKCVPAFLDRMSRSFNMKARIKSLRMTSETVRVMVHEFERKPAA